MGMTEKRKFGEFKQNRFITTVELDNSCGVEDLMKQKKYDGFREKDYQKLCSIREELNQLYYENEQLKRINKSQELEIVRLHHLADAMSSVLRELGIYDVYDDETIEEVKNKVKGDVE